jgi:adducin
MSGEEEARVNGVGASESDDEDEKSQRPVDIEADCKEMERRKRVEAIMHSKVG